MDFLNQMDSGNKNDNSIFPFNDKNDNKSSSLPFPFSSQSSVAGGNDNNIFLNDINSQGGESFTLSQFESQNKNKSNDQNNFGALDFLNTICEVPESSNNFLSSQNDAFLTSNIGANHEELDFINEEENEDNNNFDFSKFQNNNNDEPINIDINKLFKSSKTKKNETDEINNILNISNNTGKNDEVADSQINPMKKNASINNINNASSSSINMNVKINNDVKDNINEDINNSFNNDTNNKTSFIQNITNNVPFNQKPNKFNQNLNALPIIEKSLNNNNNNIKNTSLSVASSNSIMNNINYDTKDNKENNVPSFTNIAVKPTINKPQKINLDDIDQIISLNEKSENKPNPNPNISNLSNNIFPINQNFLQDNNKVEKVKDNLKFLSNELSNIFNSSIINGKRSDLDPKDKDLQNLDNLLTFTKENITSKSKPKRNPIMLSKDKISNNQINQINTNDKSFVNNTQKSTPVLKQLPSDSFDKKMQLIKLSKNEMCDLQKEKLVKNVSKSNENNFTQPSKLEMIQKYNELAARLNKIKEKAKEYRNLGNYFTQLISANENYNVIYPSMLKKMLEEYNKQTNKLLALMKIKNNKMTEMNNEFFEEVKKYSLAFSDKL